MPKNQAPYWTDDHSYAHYTGASKFDTGSIAGFYDGSKRGELQTHSNACPYGAFDMAGNVMDVRAVGGVAVLSGASHGGLPAARAA